MNQQRTKFNTLAIVALLCDFPIVGFISGAIAILLGIISLRQISKSGERGKLIAWVAILIGIAWTIFIVAFIKGFHY
jgi:hypothetical protein